MRHLLIILFILDTSLFKGLQEFGGEKKFGFNNDKVSHTTQFCLNTPMQNSLNQRKYIVLYYRDYENTFDNVKWDVLISNLNEANIDQNIAIITRIKNLEGK